MRSLRRLRACISRCSVPQFGRKHLVVIHGKAGPGHAVRIGKTSGLFGGLSGEETSEDPQYAPSDPDKVNSFRVPLSPNSGYVRKFKPRPSRSQYCARYGVSEAFGGACAIPRLSHFLFPTIPLFRYSFFRHSSFQESHFSLKTLVPLSLSTQPSSQVSHRVLPTS